MKHTPGPWKIERIPIESKGGSNTCWKIGPFHACIYDDWRPREIGISEGENEANARLIAAAPELLEACNAARRFVAADSVMTISECLQILDMAIAKAEGRDGK